MMQNRFRQAMSDGRYVQEWNDLSKEEQDKFAESAGAFTPYAHFVEVRADQDEKQHRRDMSDTY